MCEASFSLTHHWAIECRQGIGARKLCQLQAAPSRVREIAWKAQSRLTARYRSLSAHGKKTTVVCIAVARELVGFVCSVAREAQAA
ncbi:MAG: hypothetical protein ACREEU_04040 [Acetobacteraceae bacterium]